MAKTILIQSYRNQCVPKWIQACMRSITGWAEAHDIDYHCANDQEILDLLPDPFLQKVSAWPMRMDLARLILCRHWLTRRYQRVIWLDADVLIHQPEQFILPKNIQNGYAFGREAWIDEGGKIRKGVHNAFCIFEPGNPFLEYYIHCCQRIIAIHEGQSLAPQLLGPKLLKSHFSYLNFHLLDHVSMLSPAVVAEIVAGGGPHLNSQISAHPAPASNLCHSLIGESQAEACVTALQKGALATAVPNTE